MWRGLVVGAIRRFLPHHAVGRGDRAYRGRAGDVEIIFDDEQ
jgi:hypothetical protein